MQRKLVDTNQGISNGGRAERYWRNKPVLKSPMYFQKGVNRETEVDQMKIVAKYKLQGFEYGNWVNNNKREDFLEATKTSLYHISLILGTQNIGMDSTVGIAFGARGKSKALAHFEPNSFMINLTRDNGFGSLAHEYGHALDYFFGMYVDQNRNYPALSGGSKTAKGLPDNKGGALRLLVDRIVDLLIRTDDGKPTDSYIAIRKATNDNEYWIRRNELFARFFEQWFQYALAKRNIKNTFLTKLKYESSVYFKKKDFDKVHPLMDKLISEMSKFMNNKKQYVSEVNLKMAAAKTVVIRKALTKRR